ncbi:MAG TPA: penicillin-binding transpeptidase domain-containing protein [Streptosporangiaceae bacterium]|nr:penicillin-binding transpeptidase domain-containing protein [Streptosporangiaceae bacterium]
MSDVRGHRYRRSRWAAGACAGVVGLGVLLGACSSGPGPQDTGSAYLSDWAKQDWTGMQQLVSSPPANFLSVNKAAFTALTVQKAGFTAGTVTTKGSTAHEPVTEKFQLQGLGTVTLQTTLRLVQVKGKWLVRWAPSTITPKLGAKDKLSLQTTWPARAAILGANGQALTTQSNNVTVGVEGSRIKDASSLTKALVTAGATQQQASSAISAAQAHPTFFEPVFTVSQARYEQLKPALYPLPGTVFESSAAQQAITSGLSSGIVGTVGAVTAQELKDLGGAYNAESVVGQTGLEASAEKQLAGTPAASVEVVTTAGAHVATLATLPGKAGTPVKTTLDPTVQNAAEAALAKAPARKSAALVAVDASTGDLLAVANTNAGGYDQAVLGGFPPGSTFKVLTSTALIGKGVSPSSAASCPTTATVDGEVFHNSDGEGQVSNLEQAFAESCNTAFIGLATSKLQASDFPATAATYRLGKTISMGTPAFAGSVPQPKDQADLAATAIGQGRVLLSPLNLAMVAAATDTGTVRAPRLVDGAPDDSAATSTLPQNVVTDLHQMMAQVVTSGTAAGTGLPGGTYAKTGTAEYGTSNPLKIDAWLMGFKDNVAFAVLTIDSPGNGGPTDGPIAADFLDHM